MRKHAQFIVWIFTHNILQQMKLSAQLVVMNHLSTNPAEEKINFLKTRAQLLQGSSHVYMDIPAGGYRGTILCWMEKRIQLLQSAE
jgi:hypothetical protein